MDANKTAHTAGPWAVGEQDKSDNTLAVYEVARGKSKSIICSVSPAPHWDDTQKANAALIAAAPELLEALENLTIQTACSCEYDYHGGIIDKDLEREMLKARAAIAKAKGE